MHNQPELPQTGFVTREWVKRHYAISNSTLHQWITDGHFPTAIKLGPRAVRFRVTDLQRFEAKL